METKELFTRLLLLSKEWDVFDTYYKKELQQNVHLKVRYLKKESSCKGTSEICLVYDYRPERQWWNLDLMEYKQEKINKLK